MQSPQSGCRSHTDPSHAGGEPSVAALASAWIPHANTVPSSGTSEPEDRPSSLDPQETTADLPTDLYRDFRHSGSFHQRQRTWAVLQRLNRFVRDQLPWHTRQDRSPSADPVNDHPTDPIRSGDFPTLDKLCLSAAEYRGGGGGEAGERRRHKVTPWRADVLERFRTCGSNAWVLRTTDRPYRYKVATNRCHARYCPACQGERGRLIALRMLDLLPQTTLRFVTLTIKSESRPLADSIDHLFHSFRRLRQQRTWKDHVTGALWVLEITWRHEHERWHPHLHLITQGKYWPQSQLRVAWAKATGDSYIVDVRRVRHRSDLPHYLTKYLTKSISPAVWHDTNRLTEAIVALHGRKLIGTCGAWRKMKLLSPPEDDYTWEPFAPASALIQRALGGDTQSLLVAQILWKSGFDRYKKEQPP